MQAQAGTQMCLPIDYPITLHARAFRGHSWTALRQTFSERKA